MDRIQVKKRICVWYFIFWVLLILSLYLAYAIYFVDTTSTKSKWVGVFAGAIALLIAACKIVEISFCSSKNPIFERITKYFTNGAMIFVKRLFKISMVFVTLISALLVKPMGVGFVSSFVTGAFFSFVTILISTCVASKIATRSSQFYDESEELAVKQIFNSGAVISFSMVALVIIPLVILYHITKDYQVVCGFAFGACLIATLNNTASAVSKQAVSSANQVASETVSELAELDKRNPLLLLNGITKSILGVNNLSSDIYASYAVVIISAMCVGGSGSYALMGAFLPIIIAASGIFASVISVLFINTKLLKKPSVAFLSALLLADIIFVPVSYYAIKTWLPSEIELIIPIAIGAFGGLLICFIHTNFVFSKYKPSTNVVNATISGFIPTFRQIIRESAGGILPIALVFVIGILASFLLVNGIENPGAGVYGVILAILSMFSTLGIMIGIVIFGLNIKNIDIVLNTYEEDICDKCSIPSSNIGMVAIKVVAIGKNFVNASAILAAFSCMFAYSSLINTLEIDILNPYVLSSLLIGISIPFAYSARILGVASKTARRLALEVKAQIRKSPQILRYELRPNFEKCCEIAATNSCIQVTFNCIVVVLILSAITYKLQHEALGGFIFGVIFSAFGLLFFLSSSSNLVKSAKKCFEQQFNYIKNADEFNAISLNDAIFSSIRDIVNPSLCALIKLLAIIALSFIPLFIKM